MRLGGVVVAVTLTGVVPTSAALAGADLQTVHIRGLPLTIYGNSDTGFVAVFNNKAIHLAEGDDQASIRKLVSSGGKTYAITFESCNGSACAPVYRILDVSGNEMVAAPKAVGPGVYDSDRWSVRDDGTLVGTMRKLDQDGTLEYDYRDGKLTTIDHPPSPTLTGPSEPPGGDYVAFLDGQQVTDALRTKVLESRLRALVPGPVLDDIRSMAHQFNFSFSKPNSYSDFVVTDMNEGHSGNGRAAIAVASDGQVTVLYWPGGTHGGYDGSPPSKVWGPLSPALVNALQSRR